MVAMFGWSKPHVESQLIKKLASPGGALCWKMACMGHHEINLLYMRSLQREKNCT